MKEIIIRFPNLKKPSRKVLLVAVALAVVLSGAAAYLYGVTRKPDKQQQTAESTGAQDDSGGHATETPDYQMLLPAGKSMTDLGGVARVSPPDKDPVFAFADKIGEITVTVSQQPLPDAFKTDTQGELAKLAEQFSANEKVAARDTTVYIGTAKDGRQSVITTKGNVLILIKSSGKMTKQEWAAYVNTLE